MTLAESDSVSRREALLCLAAVSVPGVAALPSRFPSRVHAEGQEGPLPSDPLVAPPANVPAVCEEAPVKVVQPLAGNRISLLRKNFCEADFRGEVYGLIERHVCLRQVNSSHYRCSDSVCRNRLINIYGHPHYRTGYVAGSQVNMVKAIRDVSSGARICIYPK